MRSSACAKFLICFVIRNPTRNRLKGREGGAHLKPHSKNEKNERKKKKSEDRKLMALHFQLGKYSQKKKFNSILKLFLGPTADSH